MENLNHETHRHHRTQGEGYLALCPELDVASQGDDVAGARANLQEAVELFLECASPGEIAERLSGEIYITQIEA